MLNVSLQTRLATCALAVTFAGAPAALFAAGTETQPTPSVPADPDYVAGKAAIEAQNWTAAIAALERAAQRDPANADTQNFLGYAYRKAGNLDAAFKHYNEALRLDAKHRGAHEYIGETYLLVGDLPKAREHLAALDRLCWFSCEEYRDLKHAIEQYEARKGR